MLIKLNMIQQCASETMKANHIPGCISSITASRLREMVISSIGPCMETWEALYLGLDSIVQERHDILEGIQRNVNKDG